MSSTELGAMALLIPIIAVCIPIVAILVKPYTDAAKLRERSDARKMYERLALEKLDVIKTAVAMGYAQSDLKELDARLERLIGAEQLQQLLDPKQPGVPQAQSEILHAELTDELEQMRRRRAQETK
jgi:hypothetical protein